MGDGPEFIAEAVRDWIKAVGAKTAYIEPGSPSRDIVKRCPGGQCLGERILRKFQRANAALSHMLCMCCRVIDELLNGEIFYSLREAQIIIESWRKHYNTKPSRDIATQCPAGQWTPQCPGLPSTGA